MSKAKKKGETRYPPKAENNALCMIVYMGMTTDFGMLMFMLVLNIFSIVVEVTVLSLDSSSTFSVRSLKGDILED